MGFVAIYQNLLIKVAAFKINSFLKTGSLTYFLVHLIYNINQIINTFNVVLSDKLLLIQSFFVVSVQFKPDLTDIDDKNLRDTNMNSLNSMELSLFGCWFVSKEGCFNTDQG